MTASNANRSTADEWFAAYGVCHQHPTNKLIHWICVPLIMLSLLGLLWDIPVPQWISKSLPAFHWTHAVIAACLLFYIRLSPALALGMAIISTLSVGLIMTYDQFDLGSVWKTSLIIFITAWIGQFIGHKIEGRKPAFFEDIIYLLIGPIWLLGFLYRSINIRY